MSEVSTATRSVVVEKEFAYPLEKVWRALTESDLIVQWLMENDFRPEVGHVFQLRSTPMPHWNGIIDCKVVTVEPPERLSYTWGSMGMESVVAWTLTPTKGGTHVRMEQTGFRSEEDAAYKGASWGWTKFIGNLERVAGGLK